MEYKSHNEVVEASKAAAHKWRLVPAPQRGEVVRQFGNELRNQKAELAKLSQQKQEKLFQRLKAKFKKQLTCVILPLA